jgi:tRNA dimethylallyltransferase
VQRTQVAARAAIADIEARGKRAVLVGGTGLYVRAVVDDLRIPPTDPALRDALDRAAADEAGLAASYDRLLGLDPTAAARMEPGNRRRIVRALEVIELTGRPFSSFGPGIDAYAPPVLSVTMIGLEFEPAVLGVRIAERFEAMHAGGLLAEVQALAGSSLSRTAREAIGYRELLAYLSGEIPLLADAFDEAVRRTRRFARRQRVWFGRDPRVVRLPGAAPVDLLARDVIRVWNAAAAVGPVDLETAAR